MPSDWNARHKAFMAALDAEDYDRAGRIQDEATLATLAEGIRRDADYAKELMKKPSAKNMMILDTMDEMQEEYLAFQQYMRESYADFRS